MAVRKKRERDTKAEPSDPVAGGLSREHPPAGVGAKAGLNTGQAILTGAISALVPAIGAVFWIGQYTGRVEERIAALKESLEQHRKFHETGVGAHDKVADERRRVPVNADGGAAEGPEPLPMKPWKADHVERREKFCERKCGAVETECHARCRGEYNACGIRCESNPNSKCFADCTGAIK